jgi:hypothetical protein
MNQNTIEQQIVALDSPESNEDNEFSLENLNDARSPYTPLQKLAAVMAYVVHGNSQAASRYCEVPDFTIRRWKAKAAWWPDTLAYCRKQKQDELDSIWTRVIHGANIQLEERITNGDLVIDPKTGKSYRKPVSARDLATIAAIASDKREIIRGGYVLKSNDQSSQEIIKSMVKEFVALSKQLRQTKELKVVNEIVQHEE